MRALLPIALVLVALSAGCEKKPPEEMTMPAEREPRPLEALAPLEAPTAESTTPSRPKEPPATAGTRPAEPPTEPGAGGEGRVYVVQAKDTLWSIATRLLGDGKRWPEIQALNPGLEPQKLKVGQQIKIPPK